MKLDRETTERILQVNDKLNRIQDSVNAIQGQIQAAKEALRGMLRTSNEASGAAEVTLTDRRQ